MALGHWAKSYLNEGKGNNGGGGGGSGALIVPLELKDGNPEIMRSTKTARELLAAPSVVFELQFQGSTTRSSCIATDVSEGAPIPYAFYFGIANMGENKVTPMQLGAESLDDYPSKGNWDDDGGDT